MKKILFTLLYIYFALPMKAQEPSWEGQMSTIDVMEDTETATWEELFETLSDYEQNPIDINSATREDLEQLPFLNEQQIEDIQAYLYQYGNMQSLAELALIPSLDQRTIRILSRYIQVTNDRQERFPTWKTIARYGKHNTLFTAKIPFYERKGDDKGYLGYPYRYSLRYTFSYGNYVKAALIGAQDSGEPFFKGGNNMGFDHYSFYVLLRKLGPVKALVAGRYKLRTGLGLVINNDFGFGKTAMLSSLTRSSTVVRGYSSRSSANYLQGAAATVQLIPHLDITAFASWRYLDATLNSDKQSIATIVKSGYHRTQTEMDKKNNVSQGAFGAHLQWADKGFHIGATALYTTLSKPLQPNENQKYRRYQARGEHFWNAAVDYGYASRRLSINGETAINDRHALATINTISWQPSGTLQLTALQRFYSYRYYSLFAQSFNDGGYVQNESGYYLGATWHPLRHLQLSAYTDFVYFPWLKYQVGGSSHAWDTHLAASYTMKRFTLSAHYRYRTKEKDNANKNKLIDDATHRAHLSLTYSTPKWTATTRADIVSNDYKQSSHGWMATQNIGYQPSPRLQFAIHGAYFHTDDYASRIYAYERGPLFEFYFPAFYGEGIRYGVFARADIASQWLVIARLSTTNYFDRDHISSGLQQIDRSSMTDFELQVRWKL